MNQFEIEALSLAPEKLQISQKCIRLGIGSAPV